MKMKVSIGFALAAVLIQIMAAVLNSEASFIEVLSYQLLGLLVSFAVLTGIAYSLVNYLSSSSSSDFDELLHKLANEDGQFDKDIRNFVAGQKSDSTQLLHKNLAKLIRRLLDVLDEVNDAALQLAENSGRAAKVAAKTSDGIIKQYDESHSVALTTENISAAVQEVADNSNAAADAAKQAGEDAQEGQTVIEGVINSINELAEDVNMAAPVIEDLANQSEQIGSIVSVISDISDQTNLLALNAAIEAARAGELGRGFAVVADEVRDLSRRTAEATKNIQEMISQLQEGSQRAVTSIINGKNKADESAERALKGRESLGQITNAVSTITDMSVQTASAVAAQSSSTQSIHEGLKNLTGMIDESAQHSEESAAAAQEQTLMVDYMRAMLNLNNSEVDERTIRIYSYQNMPPFITGSQQGLTYELADYLNEKLKGLFKFIVFRLPRNRADRLVEKGAKGLVPWTSPGWHGDPDEKQYKWTPGYTKDSNCIVSSSSNPFEYDGPSSMKGKTMGGLIGYYYMGLDDLSNKGEFKRVDVSNVRENISRLTTNRIDTALVTESTARFLVKEQNLTSKIHFSTKHHQEFFYQMLSIANSDELNSELDKVAKNMMSDQGWLTRLAKYR